MNPEPRVDDRHRVLAHSASADRMVQVGTVAMQEIVQLLFRLSVGAWHHFGRAVPVEGGGGKDPPRLANPGKQHTNIAGRRQVVRTNSRPFERIEPSAP